ADALRAARRPVREPALRAARQPASAGLRPLRQFVQPCRLGRLSLRGHDLPVDRAPHGRRDVADGAVSLRAAAGDVLRGEPAACRGGGSGARRLGDAPRARRRDPQPGARRERRRAWRRARVRKGCKVTELAYGLELGYSTAEEKPRLGFFTDTSVCIGCKACEVACKEWNLIPDDGFEWTGDSYDNTGELNAETWRHVAFIEQEKP